MSGRPFILSETTYKSTRDIDWQLAVLPWGATEAHNLHLPYGTDAIESTAIAAEASRIAWLRGAKVVVLPTVPFGVNTGQLDIPLTLNMNPSTQMALLDDIAVSLSRQRIQKLLVLNGHGGNDFKQMIREISIKRDIFLCTVSWFQILDHKRYFDHPGNHADEMETSLMQVLVPDWVLPLTEAGAGNARRFKSKAFQEGWAWAQREWTKVTEDTGIGDPSLATAEKGRKFFDALTIALGEFMVELSNANRLDMYE
jgi:creatinine amidohydrolase